LHVQLALCRVQVVLSWDCMEKSTFQPEAFLSSKMYEAVDGLLRLVALKGALEPVVDDALIPDGAVALERTVTWEIPTGEATLTQTIIGHDGIDSMGYNLSVTEASDIGSTQHIYTVAPEQKLFLVFHDGDSPEAIRLQADDGADENLSRANSFTPDEADMKIFLFALSYAIDGTSEVN